MENNGAEGAGLGCRASVQRRLAGRACARRGRGRGPPRPPTQHPSATVFNSAIQETSLPNSPLFTTQHLGGVFYFLWEPLFHVNCARISTIRRSGGPCPLPARAGTAAGPGRRGKDPVQLAQTEPRPRAAGTRPLRGCDQTWLLEALPEASRFRGEAEASSEGLGSFVGRGCLGWAGHGGAHWRRLGTSSPRHVPTCTLPLAPTPSAQPARVRGAPSRDAQGPANGALQLRRGAHTQETDAPPQPVK